MSQADDIEDSSAPLVEHLIELRTRLIRSLIALFIAFGLCFAVAGPIFNALARPICMALAEVGQACNLVMLAPQEGFIVNMRIAMFGGFALAFPYIGYQLWRFVAPGLYRNERNAFLPFLIASPAMFLIGAGFAYFGVLPLAFRFFLGYQQGGAIGSDTVEGLAQAGIIYQGSIDQYLGLTMKFIMAFGLSFQLPVLLTLMGKAGLITSAALVSTRKYAIVAILVLCSLISPPDVMSLGVMFMSVYPLYEASIWIIRRMEQNRPAEDEDEESDPEADAKKAETPKDVAATSDKAPPE